MNCTRDCRALAGIGSTEATQILYGNSFRRPGASPTLDTRKPFFSRGSYWRVEHVIAGFTSNWDWLAIAQHHGLATRLLDWTTNPLNAAYFAVRESKAGPAVIHAARFVAPFTRSAESSFEEPLECTSVAIFRPRGVVPRIVRQGGLFTIHGPPERSLESLTKEGIVKLKQIVIAESYRPRLLAELDRYGINSASLFPDLDGLSSYLNWTVQSGEFLD